MLLRPPQIVFAFDLLDGYSSWSTYLPTELVNQIQVLFISHNHADHYDQSIAASVIQNGGFVVVPTENSYMGNVPMAAGDTLTISGLKIKAHSGLHSTPMRIYEVTLPGGLNFLHTGDNQTSETLPEIDSLDILLLNAWVNESGSASAVIGMHNCISILEPSIIIPGHIQEMGHAYMPGNPTSRAIYEWAFEVDNVPVSSEIKVMTWGERYLVPQELIGIIENNKIIYTNGSFVLYDNSPNPFRRSTKIEYNLRKTANVILKVYDVHGQEISTLINEIQGRGHKSVIWDTCDEPGGELSSGIYFYTLQVNNDLECNKMVLID
nr:MBL fold metallo-hydrolase [Bacteroidota bacterium]